MHIVIGDKEFELRLRRNSIYDDKFVVEIYLDGRYYSAHYHYDENTYRRLGANDNESELLLQACRKLIDNRAFS